MSLVERLSSSGIGFELETCERAAITCGRLLFSLEGRISRQVYGTRFVIPLVHTYLAFAVLVPPLDFGIGSVIFLGIALLLGTVASTSGMTTVIDQDDLCYFG